MKGKFFFNQATASFVGSLIALAIVGGLAYVIYKNEYTKPITPKVPEPKPEPEPEPETEEPEKVVPKKTTKKVEPNASDKSK